MSSVLAYYAAAVTFFLVCPRASVSNGNPNSVLAPTVELLDNRSTYCFGETAHIRCDITGSRNDSNVVYDWIIDNIEYNPATIATHKPGHTVSSSDRFVLQVHQIKAYTANYSCNLRVEEKAFQSRAKLIAFGEKHFSTLTAACVNATSNSITVLMKETNKCSPAKVYVTTGSTNCLATGLNLYLCAGLQPKTTYTISAVTTTRSANGSVLKTTLGTTVCTTGECLEQPTSSASQHTLIAVGTCSGSVVIVSVLLVATVTIARCKRMQVRPDVPDKESAVDAEDDSQNRTGEANGPRHLQPNPSYCSIEMM